jgi:hypothetical protein
LDGEVFSLTRGLLMGDPFIHATVSQGRTRLLVKADRDKTLKQRIEVIESKLSNIKIDPIIPHYGAFGNGIQCVTKWFKSEKSLF